MWVLETHFHELWGNVNYSSVVSYTLHPSTGVVHVEGFAKCPVGLKPQIRARRRWHDGLTPRRRRIGQLLEALRGRTMVP
jgi:hypothetical protein